MRRRGRYLLLAITLSVAAYIGLGSLFAAAFGVGQ